MSLRVKDVPKPKDRNAYSEPPPRSNLQIINPFII